MGAFLILSDRLLHKVRAATETRVYGQLLFLPICKVASAEDPAQMSKAVVVGQSRSNSLVDMRVQCCAGLCI